MTEKYLHHLWETKSYPVINYPLKNGQQMSVLNHGEYNRNNSGPDFKFGCVQFDNVQMHGHIEMHLKSSDWYKHNHHLDVNYNNVILHVVYENDVDIVQNGFTLPYIELQDVISLGDYQKYVNGQLFKRTFPCEPFFQEIDRVYFNTMLIQSVEQKFREKMKFINENEFQKQSDVLYLLLAQSFGTGVNKMPFETLVKLAPLSILNNLPLGKRMSFLLSVSGVIQQESRSSNQNLSKWHFKGVRPKNSPSIRIRQFAELVTYFNFEIFSGDKHVESIKRKFNLELNRIWNLASTNTKSLSKPFIDLLLINAIAPYLWFLGEQKNITKFQDLAFDLLVAIPPEKNVITKKWKALQISPKNAFESQGLIALYRYYCCRKNCLSCTVGQKVLNL